MYHCALRTIAVFFCGLLFCPVQAEARTAANEPGIDLTDAIVLPAPNAEGPVSKAVEMLTEEVARRSWVRWNLLADWPGEAQPVIVVGVASELAAFAGNRAPRLRQTGNLPAEGFRIWIESGSEAPTVYIAGSDPTGTLFGVGYFLRKLRIERERVWLPADLDVETFPRIPLRGHQLGYRPKTNSYDGFDADMWEQYIRDLIVFGINAIELMPPNTDDASDSPMFPDSQLDMMIEMDKMLRDYGLQVWIWYPLMYGDYADAANVERSLAENEMIFSRLPKIDALFIPGGDPGHQKPDVLFNYLEKEAEVLHRYHPDAEIWVSPQGFDGAWMDEFLQLVQHRPAWLSGIVYGPQVRLNVEQLRAVLPADIRIRRYPDITHNYDSQYPVPDWDFAFAATENRESINPRPRQQKDIFHAYDPNDYYGFITYSEGINDDVNKTIWSGLGWDPEADVVEILRDYSRYFIGPEFEDDFAHGLLALEQNWKGSLLDNTSVYTNHQIFQSMERRASPSVRLNWRFQIALFRSYYDAYTRARLLYETFLEDEAMRALVNAPRVGSLAAIDQAEAILNRAMLEPTAQQWRQRLFELADALFQSIRMQKTVSRHFGIHLRRGANLELVDFPLNNRVWLEDQFERIRALDTDDLDSSVVERLANRLPEPLFKRRLKDLVEARRLAEIDSIVNWTNPGPGGFYTDLGDLANQPQVLEGESFADDPAFLRSPLVGFTVGESTRHWRKSWARYVQTLYDQPLRMRYTDLDPDAQYEVRVTYSGNVIDKRIRLTADDAYEIHPYIDKPMPTEQVTMDVPVDATRDGELTLVWTLEPGVGGTGRGTQVAEVWLMKK